MTLQKNVYLKATIEFELPSGKSFGEFQDQLKLIEGAIDVQLHEVRAERHEMKPAPKEKEREIWKKLTAIAEKTKSREIKRLIWDIEQDVDTFILRG